MKSIRLLGIAALAALLAMAIVGASSAMAETTKLCSNDASPCTEVTHVHETTLSGAKAKLLSSIEVECDVLFLGDKVAGTSAPLEIKGKFTYSNCGSCEVEEEPGESIIKILKLSHETADVTGEGEVNVFCFGFIECVYNGVGLTGTAKGPLLSTETNGEVSLSEQTTNRVRGGLCPSTAKLDIKTTPLSKVYFDGEFLCVSQVNGLYNTNAGGGVCTGDNPKKEGSWELIKH